MESPQGQKPLGTRRQKSELVSSFCRLRPHGLCPRTWNRAPTPSVARGHALIKIKNIIIIIALKGRRNNYLPFTKQFIITKLTIVTIRSLGEIGLRIQDRLE